MEQKNKKNYTRGEKMIQVNFSKEFLARVEAAAGGVMFRQKLMVKILQEYLDKVEKEGKGA